MCHCAEMIAKTWQWNEGRASDCLSSYVIDARCNSTQWIVYIIGSALIDGGDIITCCLATKSSSSIDFDWSKYSFIVETKDAMLNSRHADDSHGNTKFAWTDVHAKHRRVKYAPDIQWCVYTNMPMHGTTWTVYILPNPDRIMNNVRLWDVAPTRTADAASRCTHDVMIIWHPKVLMQNQLEIIDWMTSLHDVYDRNAHHHMHRCHNEVLFTGTWRRHAWWRNVITDTCWPQWLSRL